MDKALYISMTGAKQSMLAQTSHANNLANANTVGFKADFAQARSMGVYYGEGLPSRAYAMTENPATDFSSGSMDHTGRDFDVAIEGPGFLVVQTPDGGEAYTRAGNLNIDSAGILRTGNGLPVLGGGGPIGIPPLDKIEIAIDGTITAILKGQGPDAPAQVDRLRLVNPDPADLVKSEDGLIRLRDGGAAVPDATVSVMAGFLESSNVNPINELTDMLSLARQYEMQVKLMQTVQQNSEASARLLQSS